MTEAVDVSVEPLTLDGVEICRLMAWDTDFFGFRIARVVSLVLHEGEIRAVDDWCAANDIRCLFFLADPDAPQSVHLAQPGGFQLVDVRLTLSRKVADGAWALVPAAGGGGVDVKTRTAVAGDVEPLKAIARTTFRYSRFLADRFEPERVREMYASWVESSLAADPEAVVVAETQEGVVGFVTCTAEGQSGKMDLVGVAERAQGKGVGTALVKAVLARFAQRKYAEVEAETQAVNIAAQRFYQRCGFAPKAAHYWYHKWYEGRSREGADR